MQLLQAKQGSKANTAVGEPLGEDMSVDILGRNPAWYPMVTEAGVY